jgi:hypothetical protein
MTTDEILIELLYSLSNINNRHLPMAYIAPLHNPKYQNKDRKQTIKSLKQLQDLGIIRYWSNRNGTHVVFKKDLNFD